MTVFIVIVGVYLLLLLATKSLLAPFIGAWLGRVRNVG